MLDTTGFSIPYGKYTIVDTSAFRPTFKKIDPKDPYQIQQFLQDKKGLQKYILNPKAEYKQQGLVYPNISIYETYKNTSGYQCNLKPHISIPKMLFGHSVEEVNNSYYQESVSTLRSRLKDMGVWVYEHAIHEAEMTMLHYCMNILMQSEADAKRLLTAMSKMTLGERYENHSRDYTNKGKAVRFHTKTFEFITYLKYYDFLGTGLDRIDKKATVQEKEIARKLWEKNKIPPLIRIEIRYNGKPTIRKHLRTILGVDKPTWTFKEIFDEEISRKVIQYYWHKLIDNPLNKLMLMEISEQDIYRKLRNSFTDTPQRIIDNTLGMYKRLQAQGTADYKDELLKTYSRSKWYKDQKRITQFLEDNDLISNSDLFEFMECAITQKPLQLGLPI